MSGFLDLQLSGSVGFGNIAFLEIGVTELLDLCFSDGVVFWMVLISKLFGFSCFCIYIFVVFDS